MITLPCLSLTQPWAHLVCGVSLAWDTAPKDVENRCWTTKKRGTFLIHAAKAMAMAEYLGAVEFAEQRGVLRSAIPGPDELAHGGIFGAAELLDVLPPGDSGRAWHMKPGTTLRPQYGWLLGKRVPLPFRAYKGAQRWFNVELTVDEERALRAHGLLK